MLMNNIENYYTHTHTRIKYTREKKRSRDSEEIL